MAQSGNFNPNFPCVIGNEWFVNSRGGAILNSDLGAVGLCLVAETGDEITELWPFVGAASGECCVAVEVYDITAGAPPTPPLSRFTYYPSSDLYVAPPPWTPGAYGSFNGWNPSLGALGPFWEALNSTSLTPYTWALSGQPIANDRLVFNFYGAGFDFAVRYDSVFGSQTGRWVTSVTSRALCAQYLALGANGAFNIQPYLWMNGVKYLAPSVSVGPNLIGTEVVGTWFCNPATGCPWTPEDLNKFDTGFVGGDTNGMGWVCQPTGSANNLATILQAELLIDSAATDPRLAIGSHCVNPLGGWQQFPLVSPADADTLSSFTLVPGNEYLIVFRRGAGTGLVGLNNLNSGGFLTSGEFLPGPPNWSFRQIVLDPSTHRVTQMGDKRSEAFALSMVKSDASMSLDSQPYMTNSLTKGQVTGFPGINEYLNNSPVNTGTSLRQDFETDLSHEYGWIWVQLALVSTQTDGDLTLTIRDNATNTAQGVVTITQTDVAAPRQQYQKVGVRMDPAPVLAATTQYYWDITSDASVNRGWLVQVLDEGNEPPPQGGPVGTFAATWGGGDENLWVGNPLVEYQTKTAAITIARLPVPPTGFTAVDLGEVCNLDATVLLWDEYTDTTCGGWLAYEIQRRDPTASVVFDENRRDWYRIAYIDTDPSVITTDDWEAPNNHTVEYRMRVWRQDGAPSDWTETIEGHITQSGCGLSFVSNIQPGLNVFYPDVATSVPVPRNVTFITNQQTFQPFDQSGSIVYGEIPDRFLSFTAMLRIRSGAMPCGPGCSDPAGGAGIGVFDPLRAIARAGLPYVCVKNETGDVWFAYMQPSKGTWQQINGREIDGADAVYTAEISVLETTRVPSWPDVSPGGS